LAQLGMTLGEYRAKWHLPKDCPMIAPNEAATRSALATRSASAASRFRPPRSY
jgi:predicted transcriptional regulator